MIERAWIVERVVVDESDVRVTLFCDGKGLFHATAKSAAKRDSKLRGSLEPHRIVDVLLAGNAYKPTIAECMTVGPHVEPFLKMLLMQYSLLLKVYPPTPDAEGIVLVLQKAIEFFKKQKTDPSQPPLGRGGADPAPTPSSSPYDRGRADQMWAYHAAVMNEILARSGVGMELKQCVNCGVRETIAWHYEIAQGGISCDNCMPGSPQLAAPQNPETLAKLIWNHAQYFAPTTLLSWGLVQV